jgi:hypothetical protein
MYWKSFLSLFGNILCTWLLVHVIKKGKRSLLCEKAYKLVANTWKLYIPAHTLHIHFDFKRDLLFCMVFIFLFCKSLTVTVEECNRTREWRILLRIVCQYNQRFQVKISAHQFLGIYGGTSLIPVGDFLHSTNFRTDATVQFACTCAEMWNF